MRVLGIDTATSRASVGFWVDGSVVAEEHISSRNHAASLIPLMDRVLHQAGATIRDVEILGVSAGPGSFSGLRVGLSVAKGIALASGARLVGVSTLEALANTVAPGGRNVCALLDAHKEELYMACFAADSPHPRRLSPDTVLEWRQAMRTIPLPCIVVGDAVERYARAFEEQLGESAHVLPFPEYGPRGGAVADLAARTLASSLEIAPVLEPFYIRPPEVQVSS